jgi:glyoxylase-like metal-dependent hydrolase (beta-lactamase superfamily II)
LSSNTHFHCDHTGGNETIGKSGVVIIAHDNIYQRMSTEQVSVFRNSTTAPYARPALPVVTFSDRLSLHFNGETATAYHVPNGHTDGDSIIHFPASSVIHMGDMFFNGLYPYVDLEAGGSIEGIIAATELALSLSDETTRIIPGHGPLALAEDLKFYGEYLMQATENVQVLIDGGMNLNQIIAAMPTAEWDDPLGEILITPAQLVIFIYNSLESIHSYSSPLETDGEDN